MGDPARFCTIRDVFAFCSGNARELETVVLITAGTATARIRLAAASVIRIEVSP